MATSAPDSDQSADEAQDTQVPRLRRFLVVFEVPNSLYSMERPYSEKIGRFSAVFTDTPEPVIVSLTDMREEIGGAPTHVGIGADVEVSGMDIQEAIQLAIIRLEAVLQLAALQSNAAVGVPRLRLAIERTAGAATTEMIQVEERYDEVFTKKRGLDLPTVENIGRHFHVYGNARIARALHWYRKGLNEEDPIDQFTGFWVGLEALNGPLMALLGEDAEKRPCASCGVEYEVPTSKGIRTLFRDHSPNGLEDFKLCRNLRVDIQHSTSDLAAVFQQAPQAAETARRMLRTAIYLLLGLSASEGLQSPSTIYNNQGLRAEYQVLFMTPPDGFQTPPILDTGETTIAVAQDGERRTVTWMPRIKWDQTVTVKEWRLLARTQAGSWTSVPSTDNSNKPQITEGDNNME